jgi:hypothetical protein
MSGLFLELVLKKSQKNKSRRKMRHHQQLRQQRQRGMVREEKNYTPAGFVPGVFFRRHKVEMFLLMVLAVGVFIIISFGPDKGAINEMRDSVSSVIEEGSQYWEESYPYGYKIIALTGTDIIQTSFDTLPEDLKIKWKNLAVARVQTKESGNLSEKIEMGMSGIQYAPAGVSNLSITTTLIRKKGASSILTQFDDLEFAAEIIEDNGEQVFFLFGLR